MVRHAFVTVQCSCTSIVCYMNLWYNMHMNSTNTSLKLSSLCRRQTQLARGSVGAGVAAGSYSRRTRCSVPIVAQLFVVCTRTVAIAVWAATTLPATAATDARPSTRTTRYSSSVLCRAASAGVSFGAARKRVASHTSRLTAVSSAKGPTASECRICIVSSCFSF